MKLTPLALLLAAPFFSSCEETKEPKMNPREASFLMQEECQAYLKTYNGTDMHIDSVDYSGPTRFLPPHGKMTMDYAPGRLNVEHDDQGRVIKLFCG